MELRIWELLVALLASGGKPVRVVEILRAAELALARPVSMSMIKNQLTRDLRKGRLQLLGRGRYATREAGNDPEAGHDP